MRAFGKGWQRLTLTTNKVDATTEDINLTEEDER
jgi:hypothetical protein